MKRLKLTFLLILIMCLVRVTASAHDIEVKNSDGVTIYYYWMNNKTELGVSYLGSSYSDYSNEYKGDVVIPEYATYNGKTYPVTGIGYATFYNCTGLTSITIPNSVTSIGDYAFHGCTGLTSITIPNSVTSIGGYAFYGCTGLTSITIPNSMTSIGTATFYNTAWYTNQPDGLVYVGNVVYTYKGTMPSNTNITIKDGTTAIASHAFFDRSGLTSIIIPNSVKSIGNHSFYGCTGLKSITIPNTVKSIGDDTFGHCSDLTSIRVEEGNMVYDSRNNCNAIIETASNTLIAGCKNTNIPNSITNIGDKAFYGCTGLTSVTIPNTVISIGQWAFYSCIGLTSITIPNFVTGIGSSAFDGCTGLTSVHISDMTAWCKIKFSSGSSNPLAYAHHLYLNGKEVKELVIPDEVISIGANAFIGCRGLASITLPNSLTSIGEGAFFGCTGLTSVTIPNSVTRLSGNAFADCVSLTSVTIPNSMTYIGWYAFDSCTGLTSITIPNSVTTIDMGAFFGCTGLKSITLPNSVKSIGKFAFQGCRSVTRLISFAATPPVCGYFAFDGINKQNCILSVPEESVSKYKQANQWKEFFFIESIPAGLQDIFLDNQESATIYDLNGRKMKEPQKGFNIINGKKVMVK